MNSLKTYNFLRIIRFSVRSRTVLLALENAAEFFIHVQQNMRLQTSSHSEKHRYLCSLNMDFKVKDAFILPAEVQKQWKVNAVVYYATFLVAIKVAFFLHPTSGSV